MNARDLHTAISDSLLNGYNVNSKNQILSAYNKYALSRCLNPIKLRVFDSVLGHFVDKEVSCGCCVHCRYTKINEWVTRLYAHIEDYAYCYFVTLTYRSFTYKDLENPFNKAVMDYLSDAFWHFDNFNSTKNAAFRPCLCCMSHLSDFLKRLRKNTGIKDLTFFGCQEYGHKFGSPHYHILLFSHSPLTRRDVVRSWGRFLRSDFCGNISASRNAHDKQFKMFGRVQFDDLVANGTIAHKNVTIHNKQYNVNSCFAYVAKYCGKLEYNKTRVRFAYDYYKQISNSFMYEIQNVDGTSFTLEDGQLLLPFEEWSKSFAPRINCSRGTPIGSKYVARHLDEMANGSYPTPPLQKEDGKTCVRPSYFYRKAQEALYNYRFVSQNGSYVKRNLPEFASYLAASLKCDLPSEISHLFCSIRVEYSEASYFVTDELCLSTDTKFLIRHYSIVDVKNRLRYLIVYRNNDFIVEQYEFSRSLSDYVLKGYLEFQPFCRSILERLRLLFAASSIRLNRQQQNDNFLNKISEVLEKNNVHEHLLNSVRDRISKDAKSYIDLHNVSRFQDNIL